MSRCVHCGAKPGQDHDQGCQGRRVRWLGRAVCDVNPRHSLNGEFFDIRTAGGQWGSLCRACTIQMQADPIRLGLGIGQRYVQDPDDGEYYATEGWGQVVRL